jgi:hypothetical protein
MNKDSILTQNLYRNICTAHVESVPFHQSMARSQQEITYR